MSLVSEIWREGRIFVKNLEFGHDIILQNAVEAEERLSL